ncbi:MAG: universal stress protein [Candidatus Competibacteraceae bacterium]|nr:universal stress protein [Candidatus Competibacteraceae bacterium]
MPRFRNILLVADQHAVPDALARAIKLAADRETRLTLLDVVRPMARVPLRGISSTELQALMVKERRDALERLAASLTVAGPPPKVLVRVGMSFIEIIRTVLAEGHDLLLKSPEGPDGGSLLFGSTDLHLLRKCPCPVWLAKQTRGQTPKRILAAVDLEPGDEDATATTLHSRILELAAALAAQAGGELQVVYAWALLGEELLRSGRVDVDLDKALSQTRDFYAGRLTDLLANCSLGGIGIRRHLLKGEPQTVVPELAREEAIGLIVMGTVARTGIAGFLIGNTAERLLARVDCSVLALKPPGFHTPVEPH